jgi:hypothetical protein
MKLVVMVQNTVEYSDIHCTEEILYNYKEGWKDLCRKYFNGFSSDTGSGGIATVILRVQCA